MIENSKAQRTKTIAEDESRLPGTNAKLRIGIVGSGAAGLAASWLLSRRHDITLLEADSRPGGHAHTAWINQKRNALVESGFDTSPTRVSDILSVDTGFIVYNEDTYPNFTAWMKELNISTQATDMSFAVSRNAGEFEYAGGTRGGLFAQPANLLKPRFWLMLRDLVRFYKESVTACDSIADETLGEFLQRGGYNQSFIEDHLLPFGAAIWSSPRAAMLNHPVKDFVRFCDNHGLLKLSGRPQWRTLKQGSADYVSKVVDSLQGNSKLILNFPVATVRAENNGVLVTTDDGRSQHFDHVVLACHANQALSMLAQPEAQHKEILGSFNYELNTAILHTDKSLMPQRRAAWASWNYVEPENSSSDSLPGVVYWMNKLQSLPGKANYFVSLNPVKQPATKSILRSMQYQHPLLNRETSSAQHKLWGLQGRGSLWFCGSYFGAGFHEDAVQSGFAVAEQLGGCRRPWSVENESSRIHLGLFEEAATTTVTNPPPTAASAGSSMAEGSNGSENSREESTTVAPKSDVTSPVADKRLQSLT